MAIFNSYVKLPEGNLFFAINGERERESEREREKDKSYRLIGKLKRLLTLGITDWP